MGDSRELFDARLAESCQEFFDSIKLPAWPVDQPRLSSAGRQIASVIAFGGWQIRGSLTVRGAVDLFQATHPVEGGKVKQSQAALVDWAGEVANQLLGRFKNKMLAHCLDFQVGVPSTIFGENMIEASGARNDLIARHFRTANDVLSIGLLARLAPGAEPREAAAVASHSAASASAEVKRWAIFLTVPLVLSAAFFMALISTGHLWLIGGSLVTGPGLLILGFIYLAMSSDTNGDAP